MEQSAIQIRPAVIADAGGIATVHVASWQTTYRGILPDDLLDRLSVEQRQRQWERILETNEPAYGVFVAVTDDDRIVGFAGGGPTRESDTDYAGELYSVYLLQTAQRTGTGRRLVGAVARHLVHHGLNSMLLWVATENPARLFYEALGGQWLREKEESLGGATLREAAYGWRDISTLAAIT